MRFKEVRKDSLKALGEYLGLGYIPRAAWVEDWGDEQDFETLIVEWSDGNKILSLECNLNLDILVNGIDYVGEEIETHKKGKQKRKKMRKNKIKIAHLVYQTIYEAMDDIDEQGNFTRVKFLLTRYTDPIVNGKFTGYEWFSVPMEVNKDPQTLANKYNEVIYNQDNGKYVFPQRRNK